MRTGLGDSNQAGAQRFAGSLQRALAAYSAGRLGEAEFYCRLVVAADKKQFDAVHLLGLIEFQQGKFDDALRRFRQAIKSNPRSVHAYCNLGLALQQVERHEEALTCLTRALTIEPDNLLALNNRGHVLWRLKRPEEALASLDRALAIKPDYADALCNRGNALVELRRFEEALTSYDQALALLPNDAPTLNNRANVLWALDRRDEAMDSYDKAMALDPDDPSILKDRGAALLYSDRGEEALACFDRALAIKRDDIYFTYKRGTALAKLNRFEEALTCFDQALAIQPDYVDVLGNRGNVLASLQRAAEAIASYDRALAIKPDTAEAHLNLGFTLLRAGDCEKGWKEYEWRWKTAPFEKQRRDFRQQQWMGEPSIEGKTILLHPEQGLGDTLQFVRYVPLVAALGAKVVLEVQSPLKSLLSGIGDAEVIGVGQELPPFDIHCPLLSLPLAFKTRLETIPAKTPYVSATPVRVAAWKDRLPGSGKLRVGVAWAGNREFPGDKTRSIGLARLAPLLSVPGVEFISLQKELRDGDEEILINHLQVVQLGAELEDFGDTAAVIAGLDLVISSDTSVVHLAGAMGRPTWILLEYTPDWRWLLSREDNPWYPTARLFRQPKAEDWESVVRKARDELSRIAANQVQTADL
jgi:tetratricopeptide (TPR) repeat protein